MKHKNPTHPRKFPERRYGLECYRLNHLLHLHDVTTPAVFYTIHDWEAAGARASDLSMPNRLQDWRIVSVDALATYIRSHRDQPEWVQTWINGAASGCQGYYWPITLWNRLDLRWGLPR